MKTVGITSHGEPIEVPSERNALAELANRMVKRIARHRERYLKAWVAQTGLLPSESELVEERYPMGPDGVMTVVVRVQRRKR